MSLLILLDRLLHDTDHLCLGVYLLSKVLDLLHTHLQYITHVYTILLMCVRAILAHRVEWNHLIQRPMGDASMHTRKLFLRKEKESLFREMPSLIGVLI